MLNTSPVIAGHLGLSRRVKPIIAVIKLAMHKKPPRAIPKTVKPMPISPKVPEIEIRNGTTATAAAAPSISNDNRPNTTCGAIKQR